MATADDYGVDRTFPNDDVQVSLAQPSGNSDRPVSGTRKRGRNASACSQCHSRKQKVRAGLPILVFRPASPWLTRTSCHSLVQRR